MFNHFIDKFNRVGQQVQNICYTSTHLQKFFINFVISSIQIFYISVYCCKCIEECVLYLYTIFQLCSLFNYQYSFLMAGEDGTLEVKSLEQIQRDKALRSMGLIELKGGKIMKIGKSQISIFYK